ncbi:MAG: hypothetical protein RSD13_04890 [Clostridium sp.]
MNFLMGIFKRIGATAKSGLENGGSLHGSLDEVKIFNRALNDSEIAELPVIEVNKSELTTAINNANEVLNNDVIGNEAGEYPQIAKDNLLEESKPKSVNIRTKNNI